MTKHKATDATDRHNALRILANGDATMAEVAALTGVSRQAVAKWAKAAGIDPVALRQAALERLWQDQRQALIAAAHGQPVIVPVPAGGAPNAVAYEAQVLTMLTTTRPVPKRKRLK